MNDRYLIVAAVVAVFAAVVWFMDPFILSMLGFMALFWIGIPVSLFGVVSLIVARRIGSSFRPGLTILSIVTAFGCFVGLAIPTCRFVQQRGIAAAKEYPAQVAPLLEVYRQAHGAYPTSLDQLPAKPVVPRFLRRSNSYHSDGVSYSFSFVSQGSIMDSWEYSSDRKTWYHST
ncbi:MAG: hypothetical protein ABIS50_04840 [Luteolibacter sp.]|uniref:hypothetical protein n=1 Tax=Luteolibacter sp. TaxID=1962973 RepID=UPI00326537B6